MRIAKQLIAPLLKAYQDMVTITITQRDRAQGNIEYIPAANENQEEDSPDVDQSEWRRLNQREQLEHEAMHIQEDLSPDGPLLSSDRRITAANAFTISDSSLRMPPEHTGT